MKWVEGRGLGEKWLAERALEGMGWGGDLEGMLVREVRKWGGEKEKGEGQGKNWVKG